MHYKNFSSKQSVSINDETTLLMSDYEDQMSRAESSFVNQKLSEAGGRFSTDISRLSNIFGANLEVIRKLSKKSGSLYSDDVLQSMGIISISRYSGLEMNRISKLINP